MAKNVHSATVEVLTAEVRVLMVGSRQITLSVARQLDHVSGDEIEPFGRVNLDRYHPYEVIGKDKVSGALVLSRYYYDDEDLPLIVLAGLK